jgi:hypothetical protein
MHAAALTVNAKRINITRPAVPNTSVQGVQTQAMPFPFKCGAHLLSLRMPSCAQTKQVEHDLMPQSYGAAAAYNLMQEAIASNDSPQTLCQLQINAVATGMHARMQAYMKPEVARWPHWAADV